MKIEARRLKNDFKIIYAENNAHPLICLQLYFTIGSAWEKRSEAGFSHFTEHLLFKSTRKYPQNSIMEHITNLGGYFNAYTEYDSTCFYVILPAKFLSEGLEFLAELSRFSNYSPEDFRFEKQVVIEELKEYRNNPEEHFLEDITRRYFTRNPYKNPIIGSLESLQQASYEDLIAFYRKYYKPQNSFLVAVGDLNKTELVNLTEKYFSDWQKGKKLPKNRIRKDFPDKPDVHSLSKKVKNDILAFTLPDLSDCEPDAYPLSFVTKVFASGKNSRLYERLFIKEQLIDGIKINSISGVNDGASVIFVYPKNKASLESVVNIFLEELEQFYVHGLDNNEMNEHKQDLLHYYQYSYEYVESLAASLGTEELAIGYEEFLRYPSKIKKLTLAQLNNTIKEYFKLQHLHIEHLGDRKFPVKKIRSSLLTKQGFSASIPIDKKFLETTLSNGTKVLLKKVKGKPTTGISITFEVSQLSEERQNLGINLCTSSLMLYGNAKRNYRQFRNFCTENGIKIGIDPALETTSYNAKCFNDSLSTTLELLGDLILTPTFPRKHFLNIVQTLKSNIDRTNDYPEYLAYKNWKKLLFGKNSNFISKSGRKGTLSRLTIKQIKEWYEKNYLGGKASIAIVGDIVFDRTLFLLEKYFRKPKTFNQKSVKKAILATDRKHFKSKKIGSNQSIIIIGGFGSKLKESKQNTAFHVLAQIIGGDTNSLFFNELREKRGLAYSVSFDFNSIFELGYWTAQVVVDKKNQQKTIDLIKAILKNIQVNGISERDMQTAKNSIRGQRLMAEESVANQAELISVLEAIGLGYKFYLDRDERLQKIKKEDLHSLAKEYFVSENMYTYVLA